MNVKKTTKKIPATTKLRCLLGTNRPLMSEQRHDLSEEKGLFDESFSQSFIALSLITYHR